MYLTREEMRTLRLLLREYAQDPEVRRMDNYIQHGAVTTLEHSKNVARVSFWMNRRLHLGADEKCLAAGAILHDFYLYDWHEKRRWHRLHGFHHPEFARRNAVRRFHISEKEQNIIHSHMWPLTVTHLPACREAVIVGCSDKYCSLFETILCRRVSRPICVERDVARK